MPTPCPQWPCPYLRPCPDHHRDKTRDTEREQRRAHRKQIYNSPRWKRARRIALENEPYCHTPGCHMPSTDVDHRDGIDQIIDRGGNPFDPDELDAYCHSHHSTKTVLETGTSIHTQPAGRHEP